MQQLAKMHKIISVCLSFPQKNEMFSSNLSISWVRLLSKGSSRETAHCDNGVRREGLFTPYCLHEVLSSWPPLWRWRSFIEILTTQMMFLDDKDSFMLSSARLHHQPSFLCQLPTQFTVQRWSNIQYIVACHARNNLAVKGLCDISSRNWQEESVKVIRERLATATQNTEPSGDGTVSRRK